MRCDAELQSVADLVRTGQEGAGEVDGKMDDWIEQFSQQTSDELKDQQQRRALSSQAGLPTSQDYAMAKDNPFLEVQLVLS